MTTILGLPYLAGFFDGDGSVGITSQGAYIRVASQVRAAVELFPTCLGCGRITMRTQGIFLVYHWSAPAEMKQEVLTMLAPELFTKREHAELVSQFLDEGSPVGDRRQLYIDRLKEIRFSERTPLVDRKPPAHIEIFRQPEREKYAHTLKTIQTRARYTNS